MPFYEYKCSSCEHIFEELLKVADRKKPCRAACPSCGSKKTVNQHLSSAPAVCDPVRVGKTGKLDGGFREVLSKIKKGHPRNNIPDY